MRDSEISIQRSSAFILLNSVYLTSRNTYHPVTNGVVERTIKLQPPAAVSWRRRTRQSSLHFCRRSESSRQHYRFHSRQSQRCFPGKNGSASRLCAAEATFADPSVLQRARTNGYFLQRCRFCLYHRRRRHHHVGRPRR